MRQIDKKDANWNKEIKIGITLKELQILNDSVWNIPPNVIKDEYEKVPYTVEELSNLCDIINQIVSENGGYNRIP